MLHVSPHSIKLSQNGYLRILENRFEAKAQEFPSS